MKTNNTKRSPLSEATPIQIGLVLSLMLSVSACIWWAATIASRLDTVLKYQQSQDNVMTSVRQQIIDLRLEFSVHKAMSGATTPATPAPPTP